MERSGSPRRKHWQRGGQSSRMNGYKFEYGDNPSEIAEKQIFRLLIASRYVRVNRAKCATFNEFGGAIPPLVIRKE
ncbi:Uncharacterized protein APZ42_017317 [Daphnia magna]|uniref:Uncharacterized protein n=1 Tax=Daphnia magna TaxID=35525 RepID=A0A162CJX2_9CRUS|nr:Uncharacterized protein APZ42_017317 [Daphnia magna]